MKIPGLTSRHPASNRNAFCSDRVCSKADHILNITIAPIELALQSWRLSVDIGQI